MKLFPVLFFLSTLRHLFYRAAFTDVYSHSLYCWLCENHVYECTHVAHQVVVDYCDATNSLLGMSELWLNMLTSSVNLYLHYHNAQKSWLGNWMCEVL